jgi:hypothetical protein
MERHIGPWGDTTGRGATQQTVREEAILGTRRDLIRFDL